jgi:hypothetical protein
MFTDDIIFLLLSFLINLSRLCTAVEWCVNFPVGASTHRGDVSEFGMKSEGAKRGRLPPRAGVGSA